MEESKESKEEINSNIIDKDELIVDKDESDLSSTTVISTPLPTEDSKAKKEKEKEKEVEENSAQNSVNSTHKKGEREELNSVTIEEQEDGDRPNRKRTATNPKRFLKSIFTQPDLLGGEKNKSMENLKVFPDIVKHEKTQLESQNHRLQTWRIMLEDIAKQDKKRVDELEEQIAEITRQRTIFEQVNVELQAQSNKIVEQLQNAISLLNTN